MGLNAVHARNIKENLQHVAGLLSSERRKWGCLQVGGI